MEFIKKTKRTYLAVSAVMIAVGIWLVLYPGSSARVICRVLGVQLTLLGGAKMLGYFSRDRFRLAFQFDFALGIVSITAGLILAIWPDGVVAVVPAVFGVFLLTDGAFKLQTALDAARFGLERWWSILIFAVLTWACGFVLLLNPFAGGAALTFAFGVTLIVDGVQNLCVVAYTVRTGQKAKRADPYIL